MQANSDYHETLLLIALAFRSLLLFLSSCIEWSTVKIPDSTLVFEKHKVVADDAPGGESVVANSLEDKLSVFVPELDDVFTTVLLYETFIVDLEDNRTVRVRLI